MTDEAARTTRATWAATGVAATMVAQVVASRALRDGFFLSEFAPSALPSMVVSAAVFSVVVLVATTRVLRQVAPARCLPWLFAVNAALFVVDWALCQAIPGVAAVTLYLHVMSVAGLVISSFWSVINERFDPHTAKQLIGRIGGGASLGGVVGGVAAWASASFVDIPTMLLMLALLNAACALGAKRIGSGAHESTRAAAPESAMRAFRDTPYLWHLALLVILCSFFQTTYDYVLKATAAERYTSSSELVSFFGLFYMCMSVMTFVVQNGLVRRSLEKLGIVVTAGLLPGIGAALGALSLFFPGLPAASLARGGIGVTENSLFRSGYELLYTPILPEKKRPAKPVSDVGGDMLGKMLGGGAAFVILQVAPGSAIGLLVFLGISAALAGILVTRWLHHGYVSSLATSLRSGGPNIEGMEAIDATTHLTILETVAAIADSRGPEEPKRKLDRHADPGVGRTLFLDRLDGEASAGGLASKSGTPNAKPFRPPPLPEITPLELDATTTAIVHLRSGDPVRIRRVLADMSPLPPELVRHVVPLLANDEVSAAAFEALRRVAPANTGLLLDAVRQSRTDLPARRQLCEVFARLPTQRCARGLVDLLEDSDFELRLRAAASLLSIHRLNSALSIPREVIFRSAAEEAAECGRRWVRRAALDSRVSEIPPLESRQGRRVVQGMSYVWTLMFIVLEEEPFGLAIQALAEPGSAQRGTGLEYLEHVLPGNLLRALTPLLREPDVVADSTRPHVAILSELMSHRRRSEGDLVTLRQHIDSLRAQRSRTGSSGPAPA